MKDLLDRRHHESDDIDRIVDALIADPSRAEDMKSILRGKMRSPGKVKVAFAAPGLTEAALEAEELWDNVPV